MTPKRKALMTLITVCDLVVVTAMLILAVGVTSHAGGIKSWITVLELKVAVGNVLFVAIYIACWHFVLRSLGLYRSYRLSPASRESRDLGLAVLIAIAPLVPADLIFKFEYVSSQFLTAFGCFAFLGLATERRILRAAARQLRQRGHNIRNVIVVGDGAKAFGMSSNLARRDDLGYHVLEVIEIDQKKLVESIDDLKRDLLAHLSNSIEAQPVDEVFVALPLDSSQALIWPVISLCEEQGLMVRVLARVADLAWGQAAIDELGGKPVITIFSGPPETPKLLLKRTLDLAASGLGLIVLSPLFLAVAIAIKLDSTGPVIYGQERVGYNRRRFCAWKFRTMVENADKLQDSLEELNEAQGPIFKIKDDPRITCLGRWLRRMSIDELPQLFNVLKGEMSLVGPRPLPVRDVDRIDVRWHKRRFSVKPGITCLWQADGREPTFDEWIQSDMEYIDHWSLMLDLKILFKTIPAVLSGQGAH